MKRKIVAISLLVLLLTSSAACTAGNNGSGPTPTPLPPVVSYEKAIFKVERGPITSELEVLGTIVPSKQDELFFRTSGYVTRVAVKAGDQVKKGDILAEMQVDDLLNQLQQARIDLEVAQADLTKYQAQQKFDIEKAQADVVINEKRVALAQLDLEQAPGLASKERAQLNLDIAQQNLELTKKNLELLSNENNPYMEQAVKRSELSVQRLESLLAERQITAPYDGIVLKSMIMPGRQVEAFFVAFFIGDPTNLVARVQYDYELSSKLYKDSQVSLLFPSEKGDGHSIQYLPGFVPESGTESVVESTTTSDYLYFSFPQDVQPALANVGATIRLKILLGKKDSALLLPPAAIREYKGLYFVIVLDGERRRRVEINEIGLKGKDRWEVTADLKEGDQVLGP